MSPPSTFATNGRNQQPGGLAGQHHSHFRDQKRPFVPPVADRLETDTFASPGEPHRGPANSGPAVCGVLVWRMEAGCSWRDNYAAFTHAAVVGGLRRPLISQLV